MEKENFESFTAPPQKTRNFLEFAKQKVSKKFISTLFRTINRYRSRIFQGLQKLIKLQTFIKLISKYMIPSIKHQVFSILKQKKQDPSLQNNFLILANTLNLVFSNLSIRMLSSAFHRVLFYKKKVWFSEPMADMNTIQAFYHSQVQKTLQRFDKKMKNREEIWKDRAYMKILAYAKWLKFLSPYPARNSSPNRAPSPVRPATNPFYTPERYRPVPKFNRSNPFYYPLYKMFTFIDQNKFVACGKAFKLWKFHFLVDSLKL